MAADELTLLPSVYRRDANASADDVPMLDSAPIVRAQSSSSTASGLRSARFAEHISELADTSSVPAPLLHSQPIPASNRQVNKPPVSPSTSDSPTLGRNAVAPNARNLPEKIRHRQHLLSWNNYDDSNVLHTTGDSEDLISATTIPRSPSMARSLETAKAEVSPELSSVPLDREFVISLIGNFEQKTRER
jgi:hypothetical protein